MDFSHFLTSYMRNPNYGFRRHFKDLTDQAILAEKLGFVSVSIPEHHLVNLLMMPSPLQMAVKLASLTKKMKIVTSVCVLPLHDMRIFAGEVALADILTDGRLVLGVGRGAFAWEMASLDSPKEQSKEKFNESLEVLSALLNKKNVSWNSKYYKFNPITIMPRPISKPVPMMIAAMEPDSIYNSALKGFNVQSTVLADDKNLLIERSKAFKEGCKKLGEKGKFLKISMQRMAYAAKNEKDAEEKNKLAYEYYKRFDNMFTGPGKVKNGLIEPLPRRQSLKELTNNLLICTPNKMIDKLGVYAEAGIDEIIISASFGQSQKDLIDSMYKISEQIIPHFKNTNFRAA